MGPSSSGVVEPALPQGVSVNDNLGYVAPMCLGTKPWQLLKNQKYSPKLPPLPKGMTCSIYIIPAFIRLKFDDHDLLFLKDVRDNPYESVMTKPSGLIQ